MYIYCYLSVFNVIKAFVRLGGGGLAMGSFTEDFTRKGVEKTFTELKPFTTNHNKRHSQN